MIDLSTVEKQEKYCCFLVPDVCREALQTASDTRDIYICWKGAPFFYDNMQLLNEANGVLGALPDLVVPNSEDDTDAAFVWGKRCDTCIRDLRSEVDDDDAYLAG